MYCQQLTQNIPIKNLHISGKGRTISLIMTYLPTRFIFAITIKKTRDGIKTITSREYHKSSGKWINLAPQPGLTYQAPKKNT